MDRWLQELGQVNSTLKGALDNPNIDLILSYEGGKVGLFASRSPNRPNPIGLDVARLLRIEGRKVYTSGLSVLDGTPLIDIKPYTKTDSKADPGDGWTNRQPI